jgi:GT2 family glycosyltransferase
MTLQNRQMDCQNSPGFRVDHVCTASGVSFGSFNCSATQIRNCAIAVAAARSGAGFHIKLPCSVTRSILARHTHPPHHPPAGFGKLPVVDGKGPTGRTEHVRQQPAHDPISDVTVVVMSRNRRAELVGNLGRHEASVILVDNASTDGTADAVRRAHPDVRIVQLPRNVGAAARTLGARLATTPYVAFADDDSWWAPGSLALAAKLLAEHPTIAVLNARILVGPEERLDPACAEMAASPLPRGVGLRWPRLLGFVACGAVVRRSAFLEVGGFDAVVRFPGEEERVSIDLAGAGWQLAYADELVVHHHPSAQRDNPAARRTRVTRSALLTAVLRRPWRYVAAETYAALTGDPATRRGVLTALPSVPFAVQARRRATPEVERELLLLATHKHSHR